jgi:putative ABC transport system permease protein
MPSPESNARDRKLDWKNEIRRRLIALRLEPTREAEIVEELSQHLDDFFAESLSNGVAEDLARRAALAELSNHRLLISELRRVERFVTEPIVPGTNRRRNMLADFLQDLRYSIRMLSKNPGFSAVVVLTLALGIGATAALFSVVNGVLLNPLPYPEPDRIITLHQSKPNFDMGAIPYPNFRDWKKQNQTFSAMSISRPFGFSLLGSGEPERINGRLVSADFLSVLGIEPALGRDFAPGEDEPGAEPVALISSALWQRKFESSTEVIGKSVTLDDKSYTIVGVLPPSFHFYRNTEVYVPIGQWNAPGLQSRSAGLYLHGLGRLKPGISLAQAQADLDGVMQGLITAYPDANRGNGAKLIPLKEAMIGDVSSTLWMLLGAVGFVLLIACVNVSNLLLARSTGRSREFAIRAAMGAGQLRLLRQALTESTLLSVIGGGLGLFVAGWGTRLALGALPRALPRAEEVGLDKRVLFFTLAISILTGLLSGLAPALKTARGRLVESLKEGGRGTSLGRVRSQGVMVAVEMALAVVLLIGAGLMIRSLSALWDVDPGFRAHDVLTFSVGFPPSMRKASPEALRASLNDLSDKFNSMPAVAAASFTEGASPLQSEDDLFFWVDGEPEPKSTSESKMALVYRVEPHYLDAMRIPLKQGRFFTATDDERGPNVAVIDEVLADKYFPQQNPLGRRLHLEGNVAEIVGVVGHVKQWGLDSDSEESLQAQVYESYRQVAGGPSGPSVVMRVEGLEKSAGSSSFLESINRVVRSHNSENIIFRPQTLNEAITASLAARRFSMMLLEAFAAVALLLASIGIYGVVSYLVGQRTHELGIRVALGAQRRDVLSLVLSHGMKMTLGGVATGLVAALGLTRLLARLLFGVSPTDPITFALIAVSLTAVAMLACFIPARRATRVDPLIALRHE